MIPVPPPTSAAPAARSIAVGVAGTDASDDATSRALARELGLPWTTLSGSADFDLLVVCARGRLELRDGRDPRTGPVAVDFSAGDLRRGAAIPTRRQPLARALSARVVSVVDATAGLGRDALRLALLGYRVTAIERSVVCAALLRDGLRRAREEPALHRAIGERLRLVCADARDALPALVPRPDAVFLDPMFPPKRRRSAAARKEVRLLRALVGADHDARELFEVSWRCAAQRVVVKRPDGAPPLVPNPTMSYPGKLVRYDVYRIQGRD